MTPSRLMTLSAGAMSLVLGGQATAQKDGALEPAQLQQLRQFQQICAIGGTPPGEMDCDAIARALEDAGVDIVTEDNAEKTEVEPRADETTSDAPPPAEAPDPQPTAEVPVPPAAEPPAPDTTSDAPPPAEAPDPQPTAEVPVPPAAEPPAPDTAADAPPPTEAPDPQPTAEVPVPPAAEAPAPDTTADAPPPAEAPDPQPTAEVPVPPATEPPAPDTAADAPPPAEVPDQQPLADLPVEPEPEPEAPDPQAQADALERLLQVPAAAAAGRGDGERLEETVGKDDVRRSSEDFGTTLTGAAKKKDKDNGGIDPLAGAALLGLGAIVLDQILSDGDRVVSNSGDRVVVEDEDGQVRVLRNDDVLLRRPGAEVATIRFDDGSTRNIVTYEDGTVVETIRAANGRVLRRSRLLPGGEEIVLFDDTLASAPVEVDRLPAAPDRSRFDYRDAEVDDLARALQTRNVSGIDRTFSLAQIRNIDAVRHLVPEITVDTITFETNSAAIRPEQAEQLAGLGNALRNAIRRNPGEVFLIEGHTDAVGRYAYNLALSDRRAELVALALTEYFDVPPENMVLQGYGESDLLVPTDEAEQANRRAAVRRITPLLNGW